MATPKIPAKELVELAEKAAGKGAAAADEFLELLERQSKKVKTEFEELLERTTWKSRRYEKPRPPAPSKPEPVLTQEPVPAPKPATQTKTQTRPQLAPRPLKKWEDVADKGLIKLRVVGKVVRAVLDNKARAAVELARSFPVLGLAITGAEIFQGTKSESETIMETCRRLILKQTNKRQRERLEVPERYPNGTVKRDIMRRVGGAGYMPSAAGAPAPATRPRKTVEKDPSPSPNADDDGALVSPVATDEQKRAIAARRKKARQ